MRHSADSSKVRTKHLETATDIAADLAFTFDPVFDEIRNLRRFVMRAGQPALDAKSSLSSLENAFGSLVSQLQYPDIFSQRARHVDEILAMVGEKDEAKVVWVNRIAAAQIDGLAADFEVVLQRALDAMASAFDLDAGAVNTRVDEETGINKRAVHIYKRLESGLAFANRLRHTATQLHGKDGQPKHPMPEGLNDRIYAIYTTQEERSVHMESLGRSAPRPNAPQRIKGDIAPETDIDDFLL